MNWTVEVRPTGQDRRGQAIRHLIEMHEKRKAERAAETQPTGTESAKPV